MADLYLDAAPDGPDQVIAKGAYPIRLYSPPPSRRSNNTPETLRRRRTKSAVLARTKIGYRGTTALEITRGDQRTKVVKEKNGVSCLFNYYGRRRANRVSGESACVLYT